MARGFRLFTRCVRVRKTRCHVQFEIAPAQVGRSTEGIEEIEEIEETYKANKSDEQPNGQLFPLGHELAEPKDHDVMVAAQWIELDMSLLCIMSAHRPPRS